MRVLTVSALTILLGIAHISTSSAGNLDGCDAGEQVPCFANNSYHTATYNLGPRLYAATERTRTQTYETTDLTTDVDTTNTHDDNEDLYYGVDDSLPPNVYGIYTCHFYLSGQRCTHAHIRYHGAEIAGLSDDDLQALACHETGHSLGLWHPADRGYTNDPNTFGCMVQGFYPGKPKYLQTHNTIHINSRY